ncbi:sensor domain-containing protein [Evansella cellulosilytica]|uniref:Diguanylate cyclase/phosphodiesterase with PAS/PAC sensor(S) n=1 Tax=Evansella cellulosilytica (strain ATCC 21833 / DSM 2522 / FERM P-1141 / JCM 9156 / N-4) TaxID=649639 RepID=E6TU12_EVAC2|nr:bifunctional diguanylate cyclase/phosphodiesterase [Evansella cellulosilytica]ADU32043.1 diguanylate cyclase/phosphodiesterase with PAS/PAC sensor(s) [Evansella cellulosilytica DSM 2522]
MSDSNFNPSIHPDIDKNNYPYKELLENFTEAIYVINLEGNFIDYNHGFSSLVGPGEKYLHTSFLEIVHPEDIELAKKGFVQTLKGEVLQDERLRIYSIEGNEKSIVTSKVPLFGKSGQLVGVLGIAKDITTEVQLQSQIQQQFHQFRSLLKNSSSVNCILSAEGNVMYRSPSIEKVLGYKPEELAGPFFTIVHPDEHDYVRSRFENLLENPDKPQKLDVRLRHKEGNWRTVHVIANNRMDDPHIEGVIINYHDVTEMREAQQKIHHMAYHDYLTDLPNRRYFEEQLEAELQDAKTNRSKLAVLFIDIDRFKFINDTLGHHVGDKALKEIAEMLVSLVSEKDLIARMAGDEFMILVPHIEALDYVKELADSILKRMESPIVFDHYELFVTGSIGISTYPESGEDISVILKNADLAMYKAKETKENSFEFFTPEMEENSYKNFALQNDLRRAITNNEFELYYQPKVSASTEKVVGVEALIRWNHPTLGMVSPGHFIPIAEDTGLIVPIGEWVFDAVCKQVKRWENTGFPPLVVSLNFSAIQMLQKGLVTKVKNLLEKNQVEGHWIEVEMTESLILEHDNDILNKLEGLKQLGIHIAIDDFGTGYSSLSYLKKYKFNTIKLDKSFINDIHTSADNQAIITFIIQLSNQLNMKVVAEGVEIKEQHDILQKLNCDELQGFYFSRPKPVKEFEELLLNQQQL